MVGFGRKKKRFGKGIVPRSAIVSKKIQRKVTKLRRRLRRK